jgi:hygromycin-B 4-O-kinase
MTSTPRATCGSGEPAVALKPVVDDGGLLALASEWAGRRVDHLDPLREGEDSRACGFSTGAGDRFVLRVRKVGTGFETERYVRRLLEPVGVEVPEVLGTGSTSAGLAWCVSRRVAGVTLEDLSPADAEAVAPALIDVWSAMASVDEPTERGLPGNFDRLPGESWRSFLASQRAEAEASRRDLADVVGGPLYDRAVDVLDALDDDVDRGGDVARLVHCDFGSNNVMTEDGRVTAVLDWDYPRWGDPLWDVAGLHAWRDWLTCMDIHARAFDGVLEHGDPSYRPRIRCYGIHVALGALRWERFIGATAGPSRALTRSLARLVDDA